MKADEIRKQPEEVLDGIGKQIEGVTSKEEGIELLDKGLRASNLWVFSEMAAQLAELNEKLSIVLHPPLRWDMGNIGPADFPDSPQGIITAMEPRATLRDQFAMAVVTGLLADPNVKIGGNADFALATTCYAIANAMMEARK